MKVLEPRSYVLGKTLFGSRQRIFSTVFILFVLAAIPTAFYLVNQEQDIRQNAANGIPACLFVPGTVQPGETAQLLIASYPYQIAPYIEPSSGYVMTGKPQGNTITYVFNTPGKTWTASLLDPEHPIQNGKPNIIASCKISTSDN